MHAICVCQRQLAITTDVFNFFLRRLSQHFYRNSLPQIIILYTSLGQ